jgi:monofunctional biosynthetic peptidoglycan transglycosylase
MARRGRRRTKRGAPAKSGFLLRLLGWLAIVYLAVVLLFVVPLRVINPPVTAFMLQQTNAGERRYEWVPIESISKYAALAVIASEDQRFLLHDGVDFSAIEKALSEDGGAVRGASTITQQLVKNLYLWPGRNMLRKGVEAILALTFDALVPKRRILELYLNVVEFGPGIYGVAAASEQFFSKPPLQLTPPEAALLAAALPNPAVFKVDAPSDYMRERQLWVMQQMLRLDREGMPEQFNLAEVELKSESQSVSQAVSMANPAAVFCVEQGGVNEIVRTPGGAVGLCRFPDGSVCDDWEFYRAECGPGDRRVDDVEAVN